MGFKTTMMMNMAKIDLVQSQVQAIKAALEKAQTGDASEVANAIVLCQSIDQLLQ